MSAPQRAREAPQRVVFYDGVCGFCDAVVAWLLRADRAGRLHYAPLQGETAAAARRRHPEIPEDLDTVILMENTDAGERVWMRSAAVLRICAALGGAWRLSAALWLIPGPLSAALWLIPGPLRDLAYRAFAAVRYRVFGKLDACPLPSPEQRARFLP